MTWKGSVGDGGGWVLGKKIGGMRSAGSICSPVAMVDGAHTDNAGQVKQIRPWKPNTAVRPARIIIIRFEAFSVPVSKCRLKIDCKYPIQTIEGTRPSRGAPGQPGP